MMYNWKEIGEKNTCPRYINLYCVDFRVKWRHAAVTEMNLNVAKLPACPGSVRVGGLLQMD